MERVFQCIVLKVNWLDIISYFFAKATTCVHYSSLGETNYRRHAGRQKEMRRGNCMYRVTDADGSFKGKDSTGVGFSS